MKSFWIAAIVTIPWAFIAAAIYGGLLWIFRRVQERRDALERELLRRRVNREIDHPSDWSGGTAA